MLTTEEITHSIGIPPLQLRAIFRRLGYAAMPSAEASLSTNECFCFWLALLIDRLRFLTADQRSLLADEMIPAFKTIGDEILADTVKSPMVVIADSRYAVWHGRTGWLDLITGDTVQYSQAPLESLAYNLKVLFRRNHAACLDARQRRVKHNEQSSQPAATNRP